MYLIDMACHRNVVTDLPHHFNTFKSPIKINVIDDQIWIYAAVQNLYTLVFLLKSLTFRALFVLFHLLCTWYLKQGVLNLFFAWNIAIWRKFMASLLKISLRQ